ADAHRDAQRSRRGALPRHAWLVRDPRRGAEGGGSARAERARGRGVRRAPHRGRAPATVERRLLAASARVGGPFHRLALAAPPFSLAPPPRRPLGSATACPRCVPIV